MKSYAEYTTYLLAPKDDKEKRAEVLGWLEELIRRALSRWIENKARRRPWSRAPRITRDDQCGSTDDRLRSK